MSDKGFLATLLNKQNTLLNRVSQEWVNAMTSLSTRVSSSWVSSVEGLYTRLSQEWANKLDSAISTRASAAHYTESRALKLDNIDTPVSSRASKSDWSSTKASYLDVPISTRFGGIKNVQRGTITLGPGDNSENDFIAAVDTNKSELRHMGQQCFDMSSGDVDAAMIRLELTSPTNINASRGNDTTGTVIVGWELTEWK